MAKRILLTCLIVLVIVGIYYGYKQYQVNKQDTDGAVVCKDGCDTPEEKARFAKENSGDTADGNSERKQHTAREDASAIAAGFPAGTGPVSSNDPAQPNAQSSYTPVAPNVVPEGQKPLAGGSYGGYGLSNNSTTSNPMSSMTNNAPESQGGLRQPAMAPVGLPMTDSRSPNAPNELRFAGSGAYQWYRQGNLTWRIDTASGRSCIIYATMEEWQKSIVVSHGCGRTA